MFRTKFDSSSGITRKKIRRKKKEGKNTYRSQVFGRFCTRLLGIILFPSSFFFLISFALDSWRIQLKSKRKTCYHWHFQKKQRKFKIPTLTCIASLHIMGIHMLTISSQKKPHVLAIVKRFESVQDGCGLIFIAKYLPLKYSLHVQSLFHERNNEFT